MRYYRMKWILKEGEREKHEKQKGMKAQKKRQGTDKVDQAMENPEDAIEVCCSHTFQYFYLQLASFVLCIKVGTLVFRLC